MSSIINDLAKILPTIRRSGDFYATGKTAIFAPNLEVEGVGRISLPLLPVQAEQLVAVAARAPYGHGEETLIDTDVRRTWQIEPEHIRLGGRDWPRTIDVIVAQAAAGLGVTAPVSAELYKLLIYDAGSFFVEHRDTEKAPGMFATLVLVLPSEYSGGELIIRHRGREVCLDLRGTEPSDVAFAAFYADCVHEMRPITSGYRLTLVYNLVRQGRSDPCGPPAYEAEQGRIVDLLRQWVANKDAPNDDYSPEKLIYPLEHAYTSAELGFDTLKNADAAVAAVLVGAAGQAACDLHLAIVSIEESGSAELRDYGSYRRGRRYYSEPDEDEEDEFEVEEVFDRTETVSEWRRPDGSRPAINALLVKEGELCPPDAFENAKPDEQHFHEAAGNDGASFERTYRRAALVLWPQSRMLAILGHAGLHVSMPYLAELARRWIESGEGTESPLWREAHALSAYMLDDWPTSSPYWHQQSEQEASMLASLEQLQDTVRIDAFLSNISAAGIYSGNENEALVRAAVLLPASRTAGLIERIIAKSAARIPAACANLLVRIAAEASFSSVTTLLHPAATALVETLVGERVAPTPPEPWRRPAPVKPDLVIDLLEALCRIEAVPLADRVVAHVLASPGVFDMDAVLVPAALGLIQRTVTRDFAPVQRLRAACLDHLRARIAQPLAPPPDFTRASVIACKCDHCAELSRFLADAARKEWIFKAAEPLRQHVETSIRSNGCDLDCATDKRGRPYTLVCTKNQASYERRVRQRKRDINDMAQLDAVELSGANLGDVASGSQAAAG